MAEPAVRTLLVFAHPALERGRVNPAMAEGVRDLPGLTVHDLYEVYPDFTIDVPAEHRLMLDHDLIVLQFPLYWFSMPSLLKEWMDLAWSRGFAFGKGAKLKGRALMVAVSTGANRDAYENGVYQFPLDQFLRPLEQTARYCGLKWIDPFVLHGAEAVDPVGLESGVARYRQRLEKLAARVRPAARPPKETGRLMDSQLIAAVVYLAAAAIAVPVAKRLGLGAVLGYLVAGLIIGPHALNLVGETEDVRHVAEFGVVMLLFLIGLEVRPALLWSLRTAIFGAGLGQLAGTTAVLTGVGVVAGLDWRLALATGLILSMSSTAIVLQLLEEKGIRRARAGRAAFGVLLFQDLAVIPLLAFLPLLAMGAPAPDAAAHGEGANLLQGLPLWLQAVATIAAVLGVVVAGRYLTRPAFRFIARLQLRETFTASALLLVVGVAVLMQSVGLSPALGAFLAGVVLAESEFRRELETDIEPFRGLLLGLFFITVGAGLDVPLVMQQPLLLAVLVIGLMALKGLVMTLVGRLFGETWRDAGTAGAALSQGGEFAFVLLTFAVANRVLDEAFAGLLTAAVALSMAATPLVFAAWQRLSRAKPNAQAEPENDFEGGDPQVIIAGVGRFGQIVSRVLSANGYETSVLENSVEQIALLRRFGRRVYYGDALRLDLLRAAGAETAKILVIAIDDTEKATELVEMAREEFPHLTVLARAFDRRHAYDLLNHGAHIVERETFEGGLALAAETLRALGWRAYRAERAARLFRLHDEKLFNQLRPLWGDEERFTVASRESSPRMDDLLRADIGRLGDENDGLLDDEEPEPDR